MTSAFPWWLHYANRLILALHRIGLPVGPPHVLTVRGRMSGTPRITPVSIVTTGGNRYLVAAPNASWVKNVRAAGGGELRRGHRREDVLLTEVAPADRGPVLRAYWHQHPHGRSIAAQLFELAPGASADQFQAAAPCTPVFHCAPVDEDAAPALGDVLGDTTERPRPRRVVEALERNLGRPARGRPRA